MITSTLTHINEKFPHFCRSWKKFERKAKIAYRHRNEKGNVYQSGVK
jgi:hypothetical protein